MARIEMNYMPIYNFYNRYLSVVLRFLNTAIFTSAYIAVLYHNQIQNSN